MLLQPKRLNKVQKVRLLSLKISICRSYIKLLKNQSSEL